MWRAYSVEKTWCWERQRTRGEGGDSDGWMASPIQWMWVWANSGRCWRTRKPGVLQSMGCRVEHHSVEKAMAPHSSTLAWKILWMEEDYQLLESTQTHVHRSVMPSNHLILCCPLLLLPSIFSSIRVFSNESALRIRWPNIGVSASTSVLPMNTQDWSPLEWTGLDLLAVQGTLKSIL